MTHDIDWNWRETPFINSLYSSWVNNTWWTQKKARFYTTFCFPLRPRFSSYRRVIRHSNGTLFRNSPWFEPPRKSDIKLKAKFSGAHTLSGSINRPTWMALWPISNRFLNHIWISPLERKVKKKMLFCLYQRKYPLQSVNRIRNRRQTINFEKPSSLLYNLDTVKFEKMKFLGGIFLRN